MPTDLNIFLLIGQSNMAGRGRLDEVPAWRSPAVFMFREGNWQPAEEPLHTDKPDIAGVGLGMSFAHDLATHPNLSPIGLVPCAVGGTPLSRWMPGGDLYDQAVCVARAALANGRLRGILWHQGEHDASHPEMAVTYGPRLATMLARLRLDLAAGDVPVIAGELGPFLAERESCPHHAQVNQHLRALSEELSAYACASAAGLGHNGDHLHFNAPALHEFGRRYAACFLNLTASARDSG